jgi:hypothetical protein
VDFDIGAAEVASPDGVGRALEAAASEALKLRANG